MSDAVEFRTEGHVAWITLREPVLSVAAHQQLSDAWRTYRYDPELWVAVLTGVGATFCLGDAPSAPAVGLRATHPFGWWYEHYRVRESNVWKPVILAVNGACAGSALTFVGQSDVVLASDTAAFSLPQAEHGQVPWREIAYLADRLPLHALNRLALFGSAGALSAERAQALGLVADVVPADALIARASEIAGLIAGNSGNSVRAAGACLHLSRDLGYLDGLMMAFSISDRYQEHKDSKEGPVAFTMRRSAAWEQS